MKNYNSLDSRNQRIKDDKRLAIFLTVLTFLLIAALATYIIVLIYVFNQTKFFHAIR